MQRNALKLFVCFAEDEEELALLNMLPQAVCERKARLRTKQNGPPCNKSSYEETIERLDHYLIKHISNQRHVHGFQLLA